MKHLYKAEDNAMRYYIVEDWDTDKAIVVDWDLNDEEESELIKNFENGTLEETANGEQWIDINEAYDGKFAKTLLS